MSGFEVAGLVLGIFPLCVMLLEKYEKGTCIILDMRDYHSLLREFLRELEMEECKFEDTLYGILDDTVINPQECQGILVNPAMAHQHEWYKARFSRPKVVGVFIKAAKEIHKELTELYKRLESMDVTPQSPGTDAQGVNINVDHTKYSRRLGRKLRKRYKLARFKAEYSCRIKHIRNLNYDINVLVSNRAKERAENRRLSKAQSLAIEKYYKQVRSNAHSLCNALTQKMQTPHGCGKNTTHAISLFLEAPNDSEVVSKTRISTSNTSAQSRLSFKILLSLVEKNASVGPVGVLPTYSYRWRELKVETIVAGSGAQDESNEPRYLQLRASSQVSSTPIISKSMINTRPLPPLNLSETGVGVRSSSNRTDGTELGPGKTRTLTEDFQPGASTPRRKTLKWVNHQDHHDGLGLESRQPVIPPTPTISTPTYSQREFFKKLSSKAKHSFSRLFTPRVKVIDPFALDSSQLKRKKKNQPRPQPSSAADPPGTNSPTHSDLFTPRPQLGRGRTTSFANVVEQISTTHRDSMYAMNAENRLIQDICQAIKTTPPSKGRCLGLLDCGLVGGQTQKFHVWSMPTGGCFNLTDTLDSSTTKWLTAHVSLQELLERSTTSGHSIKLSIKHRLSIGIKLASAVIQLHHTRWLRGSWGKQDIIFFADPWSNAPLAENPVVLHNLNSPDYQTSPGQQVFDKHSNPLFPLGIVLWELWFWKRLEDFDMDANGRSQQMMNFVAEDEDRLIGSVGRALKELHMEAPRRYQDAVNACLFDKIPTDDPAFIANVWKNILCPLQENFESYETKSDVGGLFQFKR